MSNQIRFAKEQDIPRIMDFIQKHWAENHILAKNEDFFRYQHIYNGATTFVLAENEQKDIQAVIGYIPYSEESQPDIATALWKSIDAETPMLGYQVLKYAIDQTHCRIACSCGLNKSTLIFYRKMGCLVGKLNHYYRLADKSEYKIAQIPRKTILAKPQSAPNYSLKEFHDFEQMEKEFDFSVCLPKKPYKSPHYIRHRYFQHPIYHYRVYGIMKEHNQCQAVLIAREQQAEQSKILRIIDYIGEIEDLAGTYNAFTQILAEDNYEYIDFYQYGIADSILNQAGFGLKQEDEIIPNYFEPFVKENIDIYFYSTEKDNVRFFKGDADQDRPNWF